MNEWMNEEQGLNVNRKGKAFGTRRAEERESRRGEIMRASSEKKKVGRSEGRYQEFSCPWKRGELLLEKLRPNGEKSVFKVLMTPSNDILPPVQFKVAIQKTKKNKKLLKRNQKWLCFLDWCKHFRIVKWCQYGFKDSLFPKWLCFLYVLPALKSHPKLATPS